MARNKINFAAQGLFVGPSPATGLHFAGTGCGTLSGNMGNTLVKELHRIQGVDYSFDFEKENIAAFGDLAPIDYAVTTSPVVNLNFSYLSSNFINEKNIGFTISSGGLVNALSGIISTEEDRNYFLAIHGNDGEDLHNNPNNNYNSQGSIIGIGNGVINNYSFNVSVGQFPTVNVGVEALNMRIYDKQSSLIDIIMNNNYRNGNLDIVNTGVSFWTNNYFQNWNILNNPTDRVKITPDPANISNRLNQDLLLMNSPSGDSYFTSSTTGATNWTSRGTSSSSGLAFINTGTDQLVLRRFGLPPAGQFFSISNGSNNFTPPLVSGAWYRLDYDLASSPDTNSFFMFGGTNDILLPVISTGLNSKYYFITGSALSTINGSLIFQPAAISGDYIFNKIELFSPSNYSARFQATGTGAISNQLSVGSDISNYLNAPQTLDKRFNLSFDFQYTGFSNPTYGNPKTIFYASLGSLGTAPASIRTPQWDLSYSGRFNKATLQFSNSNALSQPAGEVKNLVIGAGTTSPEDIYWFDNIKLEETNITDIINGNRFNGSFEVYHPSYSPTGIGNFSAFSGLNIFADPGLGSHFWITGSSPSPFDRYQNYNTISANIRLINKTGSAGRYVAISPNTAMGINHRLVLNKRHKFSYYSRCSGALPVQFRFSEDNNFSYYTTTLNNDNAWVYNEFEFIPTGATTPKVEVVFTSSAQTGDQIWLDEMNLSYFDDCYELPVIQNVTGGFGIPINPTTNYSGLSTNNNLKSLSVLNPKDAYLNINYSDLGVNVTGWKLQSINLDLPLNRERIYKIDQTFPDYRLLFPIVGNISLNAITTDLVTGDLYNYYFNCNKNYDLSFGIESPCNGDQGINFIVKKAKLNGLSFNNPINGKGQEVTMDFIYTIPSPSATTQGLFLSGITDLS